VGALTTLAVFLVATLTKLEQGTWLVIVLIPVLMGIFLIIHRHYTRVAKEVAEATHLEQEEFKHTFIVPVSSLNSIALKALKYARSLSPNVTAVHIVEGEEAGEAENFNREWVEKLGKTDIKVVIIESPYRSLMGPLLSYIDALDQQHNDDTITVVLPEVIPSSAWEYLLHNQSALRLKARLLFRRNTVVCDVPYHLGGERVRSYSPFPWGSLALLAAAALVIYLLFFS
jgi:hypothetical protein